MRSRLLVLVCVYGVCLGSLVGDAQTTTGRLIGTVVDNEGLALPGATITISSPALIGGTKVAVADVDGSFSFIGLAPGNYTVDVVLSGYLSQQRQEVKVPLGGAASLNVTMPSGTFENEIEIVSETPVIDPTQVNTEQIFDRAYLENAAIGSNNRSYQSVLTQAAGVVGGSNPNVFGSTARENAYYIDGMDTTDPATATFGTNFAFDAIAEIELQTSGFEAEFGRATGGVVSLITKSGGNNFSGTFDARYRNSDFQESGEYFNADESDTSYQNYQATLGGPIVRDTLWFFVAFNNVDSQFTPANAPTTRTFIGNYTTAKLTWQAGANWRVVGKYTGDPADIDNASASQFRAPEADRLQTQGAEIYNVEFNGMLSDSLLWNTVGGIYRSELDSIPMSGDVTLAGSYDFASGTYADNYSNQQYSERNRDEIATDLTWFVDNLAGSHEIKGGLEYAATDFSFVSCSTGNPDGPCLADSESHFYYTLGGAPYYEIQEFNGGPGQYQGSLQTAFVQDSWRVTSDLTLKLGVRYDNAAYDTYTGDQVADMGMWQPRFGLAWDLTGNAKNILRANVGRFMHPDGLTLPQFIRPPDGGNYRWYSCSTIWRDTFGFDINSAQDCADVMASLGRSWQQGYEPDRDPFGWGIGLIFGGPESQNLIDPDVKAPYADTISLGYEREVGRRASVSLTYVNKRTRDIFEDTCIENIPEPTSGEQCQTDYFLTNLEPLKRDYEAFILRYENRTFSWLTLLASYTYSTSEGNMEYSFGGDYRFDQYPWHWENTYGYLSDHREHRVKLNGFFTVKGDWTFSFDGFWSSAFRWEPQGDTVDFPEMLYGTYLIEPRGNREGEDAYGLDLQVSKGFRVGPTRLVLIGSVFNVFSTEYVTEICEDLSGCGNFALGDPAEWATPRRYEVGFRVEF